MTVYHDDSISLFEKNHGFQAHEHVLNKKLR